MKHQRCFVVFACALVMAIALARVSAQSAVLAVERQGTELRLSAPHFHFLEGRPLEQLHDGAAITYRFAVTVMPEQGGGRLSLDEARFVVSYDLWEERFAVTQITPARRSASHLTTAMAEAWCLDNVIVRAPAASQKPFVVKLECSVPGEDTQSSEGLTLSTLIDVLSKRRATAPPHWEVLSGPVRLADLKDRTRRWP